MALNHLRQSMKCLLPRHICLRGYPSCAVPFGLSLHFVKGKSFVRRSSQKGKRVILKVNVEEIIRNPDSSFISRLGRLTVLKNYGDKFLKVIYEKSKEK